MTHALLGRLTTALPIGGLLVALLFGSVALAAQGDPADRDAPADATTTAESADAAAAPGQAETDTAAARETEPENDAPPPASAGTTPSGTKPAAGKPTPDVFVPTEEISEDYAVSFPVDI
jgi:outer membrane biosynthesis protein TonB